MEKPLANFIRENVADLTINTRIDIRVLLLLVQDGVLSDFEKDEIELEPNELKKSDKFYSLLRRKTNQELWKTLNTFKKTNQSQIVVQKLEEFLDVQAADCGNCAKTNKKIEELLGDLSIEREKSVQLASSVRDLEEIVEMLRNRLENGPVKNIPSGLLSFENTGTLALAVVLKNSTSTPFLEPNKYYAHEGTREYCPMPPEIPPFSEHGFGFTYQPGNTANPLRGLFSFQIRETRFVALYGVNNDLYSLGLAFLPPNDPVDKILFNEIRGGSKSSEKRKVFKEFWTKNGKKDKLEVCLQFEGLCADATMTTKEQKIVMDVQIKTIPK